MSPDPNDVDTQALEDSADKLEDIDRDVSRGMRWYAKIYLTTLFAGIVAAAVAAIYFGILNLDLTVSAVFEIGWILEYVAIGIAAAFLFWTFAMIIVVLPGSFSAGLVRFAAGIAEAGQGNSEDRDDE